MEILRTQNENHGFYGTISAHYANPRIAWREVSQQLQYFYNLYLGDEGDGPEIIRTFLDSTHGRHFADTVLDEAYTASGGCFDLLRLPNAISRALSRWHYLGDLGRSLQDALTWHTTETTDTSEDILI